MTIAKFHSEWLNLIEVNGPFVTLPVLAERLRSGLEPTDSELVAELHTAQREVEDDPSLHPVWTRWVITRLLGFPDEVLREGAGIGSSLTYRVVEHGETLRPDFVVADQADDGKDKARLLINIWPPGTDLTQRPDGERWAASPIDRIAELCRATTVRLGLVTNGDAWTLVDAPADGTTGTATWDAVLWSEERATLDAFTTLLGVRRFFTVADNETLEALLIQSASAEAEVTDQLGKQVRAAVELLVDAMSRADRERNGSVFRELVDAELDQDLEPYIYEAAVTVLMRLVFLLSAEERGLFLLGDPIYDGTYAVSTLLAQLDEDANRYGEDVLERRTDAWHRLLATFRMVHAGAAHANLRLLPYGGSLFDPDRFPFLEGRRPQPSIDDQAAPLRIDNRTIKHILDALQVLRFRGRGGWLEARRLSFRSLGVEQIGHVYEGLLDHGVVQVTAEAVALTGRNDAEIALGLIEEAAAKGHDALVSWLAELTGDKPKSVERALAAVPEPDHLDRLASACDNDPGLATRIAPYLGLLRIDLRGLPQVYLPDSYYVTKSSDRRSSGAYYTPRVLAEEMVTHTLEPLVYKPGPADSVERNKWRLRSSLELLDLRLCDMAMGSGAFLVSACRYLSERLLEAWEAEGCEPGDLIPLPGRATTPMPDDETDREVLARRLVADRCLYGVDRNPMAVEMAKLSLWLITLAKDRPFNFVDHTLRCGDSLLGITDLRQLDSFHLDPDRGRRLHGGSLFDPTTRIEPLVTAALEKRRQLESFPVIDVQDAKRKRQLLSDSNALLGQLKVIADLVVGAALATATQPPDAYDSRLLTVAGDVNAALDPNRSDDDRRTRAVDLSLTGSYWLDEGRPPLTPGRQCFHWVLEFPEVFAGGEEVGFDAVIGNPPFLGGTKISTSFGLDIRHYIAQHLALMKTDRADLVVFFLRRAATVVRVGGCIGILTTNSIREGDSREAGLDVLLARAAVIYRCIPSCPWPGDATLEVCRLWISNGPWVGERLLDGERVDLISSSLRGGGRGFDLAPQRCIENAGIAFEGSKPTGTGFVITSAEAQTFLDSSARNSEVVIPYLSGQDLNNSPNFAPTRWIIDFQDWPEDRAASYPEPFRHLERMVKPERLRSSRARTRTYWWQHEHPAVALYRRAAELGSVIGLARVSKTLQPSTLDVGLRYSDKVIVILRADLFHFGLLASCFHWWWAETWSPRLRLDPSYNPSDSFETFPRPTPTGQLDSLASDLDRHRRALMIDRWEGLTKTYNRVHDRKELSADVLGLRAIHAELDHAVAAAYGWENLILDHGFHETRQGERYTIGPATRLDLLDRLLQLNQQRHADEAARGLQQKASKRKVTRSNVEQLF